MNWRNVKLIFRREVHDQLRDRRTLFMVAILPLLLYPALGVGTMQLMAMFSEQSRTVVLLGSEHLPPPPLLKGGQFDSTWFRNESDAGTLRVVSDAPASEAEPADQAVSRERATQQLQQARQVRDELRQERALEQDVAQGEKAVGAARERLQSTDTAASAVAEANLHAAEERLALLQSRWQEKRDAVSEAFSATGVQVIILVPEGFRQHIEKRNRQLRDRRGAAPDTPDYPRPEILYNKADDKSLLAFNRVAHALEMWEQALVATQLQEAGLPAKLSRPVEPTSINVATETQSAASGWAKLLPALLVIMAVTGAFYPAIDMCAGEKERGTMETLLICPASRTEIVLGKFFAVMSFSSATALLNLLSMGLTGQHLFSMSAGGGGAFAKMPDLALPTLPALAWLVLLLIPLSSLFSALSLSFATFARSSKEGQYYLTPLLMVTLGLTVFCMSPGVELRPIYSVTPIVGVALLLKAVLLAPLHAGTLYLYALPVLATSFAYSALALWWAIEQFNREDVLFREAERLDVSLWVKHLLRDKEPTPSFTEAGFCFVLIMLLQFGAMKALSKASLNLGEFSGPFPPALKVLMIQQLAIIACPALFMGIMLTTNIRQTFRLYAPDWKTLGVAFILPLALHPLTIALQEQLSWFFEPLRQDVQGVLKNMIDPSIPLWSILLAFAVAPAICEELAFRGFILSGFDRRRRTWVAIVLSSVAFGGMHMIPQQVFNASLLGLILAMLAIRGNSLFACMLFHLTNNSLAVLHGRWSESFVQAPREGIWHWFISGQAGGVHYTGLTKILCFLVAAPLIAWLIRGVRQRDAKPLAEASPLARVNEVTVTRPAPVSRTPVH